MADVTLVLDNADGLLPVDFQVLELGRRLYRSGENDYLLNRSPSGCATWWTCSTPRTSPTTPFCSSARAWSTRPWRCARGAAAAVRGGRRRPPPRAPPPPGRGTARRVRGEPRPVEDILGELRPQARRLAAQAEQQATREPPRTSSPSALLLALHARWHEAAARLAVGDGGSRAARTRPIGRWPRSRPPRRRPRRWPASSPCGPRSSASVARPTRRRRPPSTPLSARRPPHLRARGARTRSPAPARRTGGGRGRAGRRTTCAAAPVPPRDLDLEGRSPRPTASWPTPSPSWDVARRAPGAGRGAGRAPPGRGGTRGGGRDGPAAAGRDRAPRP